MLLTAVVILSPAKNPSECANFPWILRTAQDDGLGNNPNF
jgi:hypothetical protein